MYETNAFSELAPQSYDGSTHRESYFSLYSKATDDDWISCPTCLQFSPVCAPSSHLPAGSAPFVPKFEQGDDKDDDNVCSQTDFTSQLATSYSQVIPAAAGFDLSSTPRQEGSKRRLSRSPKNACGPIKNWFANARARKGKETRKFQAHSWRGLAVHLTYVAGLVLPSVEVPPPKPLATAEASTSRPILTDPMPPHPIPADATILEPFSLPPAVAHAEPTWLPPHIVTQIFVSPPSHRSDKTKHRKNRPTRGDWILIREPAPNRQDIVDAVVQTALNFCSESEMSSDEEEFALKRYLSTPLPRQRKASQLRS